MNPDNRTFILDSFAMLAYLAGEPGMPYVRSILRDAECGNCRVLLSLINLGEVLYITEREAGIARAREALAGIEQLPIHLLPVERDAVLAAAHVKARFRVSYADAFAVAAALQHDGIVVTGNPEFHTVERLVSLEWLPT